MVCLPYAIVCNGVYCTLVKNNSCMIIWELASKVEFSQSTSRAWVVTEPSSCDGRNHALSRIPLCAACSLTSVKETSNACGSVPGISTAESVSISILLVSTLWPVRRRSISGTGSCLRQLSAKNLQLSDSRGLWEYQCIRPACMPLTCLLYMDWPIVLQAHAWIEAFALLCLTVDGICMVPVHVGHLWSSFEKFVNTGACWFCQGCFLWDANTQEVKLWLFTADRPLWSRGSCSLPVL